MSGRSVRRLKRQLNRDDFISFEAAAERLRVTPKVLESRWIRNGVLRALDFGVCRKIAAKELESLEILLKEYVTAAEGGRILNMHRSYLPNLERRGVIQSKMIGTGQRVRLYARSHLEGLKRLGSLKSE